MVEVRFRVSFFAVPPVRSHGQTLAGLGTPLRPGLAVKREKTKRRNAQ